MNKKWNRSINVQKPLIEILLLLCTCGSSLLTTNGLNATLDTIQVCPWPSMTSDNCAGPSLQYVLENYEQFFTSHTTLELLPGLHEVNVSVGSIVVRDIVNFTMIGAECHDSVNGHTNCSEIKCSGEYVFGLTFISARNVTLSKIGISNCSAYTAYVDFQYLLTDNVTMMSSSSNIWIEEPFHDYCNQFTLMFAESENVVLNLLTLEHTKQPCVIAVASNNLEIKNSSFNIGPLFVAVDESNTFWNIVTREQNYFIKDCAFTFSQFDRLEVLYLNFHHTYHALASIFLENVTLKNGRLMLSENNFRRCGLHFGVFISIKNLSIIGKEKVCYGFVRHRVMTREACVNYNKRPILMIVDSHFINSNFDLGANVGSLFPHQITMTHVEIESTPCTCSHAMFVSRQELYVTSLTLKNSCAPVTIHSTQANFYGVNQFHSNKDTVSITGSSHLTFDVGNTVFANNEVLASSGSIMYIDDSLLIVSTEMVFINNTGNKCGGIMARSGSQIVIKGLPQKIEFRNNRGHDGGALSLYDNSKFFVSLTQISNFLQGSVFLDFIDNSATHYGGAIYIDDPSYAVKGTVQRRIECAFTHGSMVFRLSNNTASFSGSALYGGWIDICENSGGQLIQHRLEVQTYLGDPSPISSSPSRVCVCKDSVHQCNITHYETKPMFPGQSLYIYVVAVGQRFGTVPTFVTAKYENSSTKLNELQQIQNVDKTCSPLNYSIESHNFDKNEILLLTPDQRNIPEVSVQELKEQFLKEETKEILLVLQQLHIIIPVAPCPLGYQFDNSSNMCVCHSNLLQQGIQCDISRQAVLRAAGMWINATFDHIIDWMSSGVIVHHYCPLDYCKEDSQYIDLEHPSNQCNFNRSGVLCGSCGGNLSHIFGTSKCRKCSSLWAILVVPTFLLLGLGLVALLTLLNLTVTQGTINALIFYANIVRANQAIFFTSNTTNTFLSWFVAWVNLDVGIEVCFFNGLNAYTKTWLQCLFPFYIWILVITIIVSSHYSTTAARLSGTNAVQVLATLFLLSYAKLLRIIITTFSSTVLVYPNGYTRRVWVYDGNVDFLEGKHIALFVAALLLLVFISFPYTVVLFFIQWLQYLPPYRVLRWIWRLKPLFDAHIGLYRDKHRYWTGLLLLVRVSLFLLFSLNIQNDPALNLLATVITCICLFAYLAFLGGVHKSLHLDILEYLFLLNLGILSAGTFYTRLAQGNQDTVIKLSVSVAFITFLILVLYHVYLRIKSSARGSKVISYTISKIKILCNPFLTGLQTVGLMIKKNDTSGAEHRGQGTKDKSSQHSKSSIELRESLLVDNNN